MLAGGHAENALPQSARATINCRILPHDDAKAVDAEVQRLAGSKVEVKQLNPPLASPPSPLRPDVMEAVEGSLSRCGRGPRSCHR
jgi:acetylornithine deacetylase/succinyl-diaminopimelate desuccinylase-like protein